MLHILTCSKYDHDSCLYPASGAFTKRIVLFHAGPHHGELEGQVAKHDERVSGACPSHKIVHSFDNTYIYKTIDQVTAFYSALHEAASHLFHGKVLCSTAA